MCAYKGLVLDPGGLCGCRLELSLSETLGRFLCSLKMGWVWGWALSFGFPDSCPKYLFSLEHAPIYVTFKRVRHRVKTSPF